MDTVSLFVLLHNSAMPTQHLRAVAPVLDDIAL